MRKRYELNGKNYSVDPTSDKGKAWLEENSTAKLIGTIVPKKDQSSAKDATTEQKPTASNREAVQTQNNTELNSEDGLSESQKTINKYKDNPSRDKLLDINDNLTIIDKTEEEVANAFLNSTSFPGIGVEKTGFALGNAVAFTLPDGSSVNVDLNPFTLPGAKEADEGIQKVKEWYANKDNKELMDLGIFDMLGRRKDFGPSRETSIFDPSTFNSLNKSLNSAGYEVKTGFAGSGKYNLIKNGERVLESVTANDIQSHLWSNINDEDKTAINDFNATQAVELYKQTEIDTQNYKESIESNDKLVSNDIVNTGELGNSIKENLKGSVDDSKLDSLVKYLNNASSEDIVGTSKTGNIQFDPSWKQKHVNNLSSKAKELGFTDEEIKTLNGLVSQDGAINPTVLAEHSNKMTDDFGSKVYQRNFEKSEYNVGIRAALDNKTFKSNYNLEEQLKSLKSQQEFNKKEFDKNYKSQVSVLESTLQDMKSKGIPFEFVGEGENMMVTTSSTSEDAISYVKQVNSKISNISTHINEYNKALNSNSNDISKLISQNNEDKYISSLANKEYNTMEVLGSDFSNATKNLLYGVPAAFGNEDALVAMRDIQTGSQALRDMLTYEEAIALGQKGQFTTRSFTQQAPNLITAVGMSALGVPPVVMGGVFGASAAGGKRLELNTLRDQADKAKTQLAELELNKENMDPEAYAKTKKALNSTIIAGTMTDEQLNMAVFATGAIEGAITSIGMGTLGNANKILTDVGFKTAKSQVSLLLRGNTKAASDLVFGVGKEILGELAEEEAIYFSDEIAQSLIFNRDTNFDQWDDIAVSTLITTGLSNGPTALYNTVTTQMATSEFREEVASQVAEYESMQNLLVSLGDSKADKAKAEMYKQEAAEILEGLGLQQSGIEVDAMVAGKDNIYKALESNLILDEAYREAGVKPNDSKADVDKKIEKHKSTLSDSDSKLFESKLKLAQKGLDKVHKATAKEIKSGDVNDLSFKMFGDVGSTTYNRLLKSGKLEGLSNREQLVAVNEAVKSRNKNALVKEAKSNPAVVQIVEAQLYGEGGFKNSGRKNRKTKQENDLYFKAASIVNNSRVKATAMYEGGKETLNALKDNGQLKDLQIIEAKDIDDMMAKLDENTDVSNDDRAKILKAFEDGANGFILDGKYLTFNEKDARAKLDAGDLMQGTVFMHEVGHALDNLTMKEGELNTFALNLSKYLNDNSKLKEVHEAVIEDLTTLNYWDKNKSFEDQSDVAKDEYIKYAQDAIANNRYYQIEARKAGASIGNLYRGFIGKIPLMQSGDFKLNTPQDAMNYMISYIDGFNEGRLSNEVIRKKSAKERAQDSTKIEGGRASFTPEETKEMVDEMGSPDSGWTNDTWKNNGGGQFALSQMQELKLLDGLIAAKMKGGLRDGSDIVKKEFISKVYAELTSHVNRFKPEDNDSLFAYVNAQLSNKAGNVYNREYKDKSLERAVDIGATTAEGAPLVQIEADTDIEMDRIDQIGLREEDTVQKSKLRRQIGLDDKMVEKVKNAVIKTFGTKLPDVGTKQFKMALQKAFRTELKKPIQDMLGSRGMFDKFLEQNFENIFNALPAETFVQMERNLPPENRIFTKSERITEPTRVDKLIAEGKLPKNVSRTSGPQLHTKKAYPGNDKVLAYFRGKDMLSLLNYEVGASTLGTRKDKLAMELGVELAFDAVADVLKMPDVQERRKGILELQGKTQDTNELVNIASIINRDPNIKFSQTVESTDDALVKAVVEYLVVNAGRSGLQIIKDRGILDPAVKKTIQRLSAKTGLPKDIKVSDFDAVLVQKLGKELRRTTLGEETARLLNIFGAINPLYKTVLYEAMTNDVSRNFIGSKKVFEALVGNEPLAKADFLKRFAFNKNKKLDPNRVKMINGKLVFIDGKGKKYTGEQILEFERQKMDLLVQMFKDIETHLKDNPSDAWFFAKFVGDAASNGNAIFRTSASIIGAYVKDGKLDYDSEMVEEHMMPQNNIGSILLAAAIDSNSLINVETIGKIIKASFTQLSLLKTDDLKLDAVDSEVTGQKSLVSKMPKDFWNVVVPRIISGELDLDDGMAAIIRYAQAGINLNNYTHAPTNQTFTAYFGVDTNLKGKTDQQVEAIVEKQNDLISKQLKGEITKEQATKEITAFANTNATIYKQGAKTRALAIKAEANLIRYSISGKSKGMSTFDFDETLIIGGENFVIATHPETNDVVKILSHEWPIKGPDLAAQDYQFDFSDFANVRGGKEGPLLQKMKNQVAKYGNKNVFVLTARQQDSAVPIKQWLKSQGIDIPLRNITGLGKSEGEAKAEWMLQKFAEGYNDMYFVDDALPNVEAVKKVLDQLDIKSKVVQAKIQFSKTASQDFNKMLERSKGADADVKISDVDAKLRGAKRDKFRLKFFVPPSAEDFKGLVYAFLGKGEQGNKDMQWFKDNLFNPFAEGTKKLNSLRQKMSEEYTALKKQFPDVVKSLNDKVANTEFTVDNAIRVYLWNMAGFETPGLSDTQKKLLIDTVAMDSKLVAFADILSNITRTEEGYVEPKDYWVTQNIGSDLHTVAETINRKRFLAEWQENADLVFSKENLNKIEAIYGSNFREALEDMLYRMKTGSNRPSGRTSVENKFLNWVNGAVSAVMFFNMRSAALQSLSMVNFMNFEDNNVFAASKAFADQKQFWEDFSFLFNSDYGKQRRAGLKIDVSASELTDAFAQGKNKTEAVIKYMLEKGFIPTKMMDSFAIAMGGSTFYRNRVNKLIKEGMSKSEAENQAFLDFQEIAEETQQSSRPDLISMQQASSLGRLILAWANTPMQYTRLTKKALSDIINGRGDLKSNVSRILYYGAIQNIIFGTLQTGLAFLMFGDEEEDKDRDKKEQRVLNGMLDTLLRGVGVYGALVSTAKNTLIAAYEELGKGFGQKDYSKIMQQLVNLSPPVGSKVRKIIGAIKSYDFNKNIIDQMGHGINNPAWNIFTGVVEGVTNAPLDRIRAKLVNVREAFVGDHEMWQRIALVMGWNKWDLNVEDAEIKEAREEVKEKKKQERKKKKQEKKRQEKADIKEVRCRAIKSSGGRCKNKTTNKNKKCYAHQ